MSKSKLKIDNLRALTITQKDIEEQLNLQLNTNNLDIIVTDYHERNGSISFLKRKK
jgi:hypothetical protein